jgi:hypothetical protein
VGGGSTLPDGVIPRAGVGKTGATGQTLTVTYADLVDLRHSVNRTYRDRAKFMMNELSVATVSKIVDTTGRPVWSPAMTAGAPDLLCGYPVAINDDAAVMAADAKSIAFGDFSQYYIRDVQGTTSLRRFDDSAFALKQQVGLCGWTRSAATCSSRRPSRCMSTRPPKPVRGGLRCAAFPELGKQIMAKTQKAPEADPASDAPEADLASSADPAPESSAAHAVDQVATNDPPAPVEVKARVLRDCVYGKCDDVVSIDASLVESLAGVLDADPDAVAYAESLIEASEK